MMVFAGKTIQSDQFDRWSINFEQLVSDAFIELFVRRFFLRNLQIFKKERNYVNQPEI